MKTLAISLAVAGAMLLTGCSALVSLNPFVTEEQSMTDPALAGIWSSPDNRDTYWIRQDGSGYRIRCSSLSDPQDSYEFRARLTAAGDVRLLDVVSAREDEWQLPLHIAVRVWIEGNTLRVAALQSDWLREQARRQLPLVLAKDRDLITASGNAVREFLLRTGISPDATDEPEVLHRLQ